MKAALIFLLVVALFAVVFFLISKTSTMTQTAATMKTTPPSAFKTTPLHEAAEMGYLETCEKLVAEGADIEAFNDYGETPLILAVTHNNIDTTRWLLKQGARMSYTYQRENTPEERKKEEDENRVIMKQSLSPENMSEVLKDLPKDLRDEMISDEGIEDIVDDMVELHFAPTKNHAIEHCLHLPMLQMLVKEFEADINHVDESGYWPLSNFSEADDLEAVTWLLENNADPNTSSSGETAIFKAIQNDNVKIVQLFVKHGAKIDAEDCDGWSVLFPCESIIMAKYLIEQGADPTALDQAGFPCWNMIDDQETKDFLKKEAQKRGLKKWTTLSNDR